MAQQSIMPFFGNRFMSRRPQDADPLLALRRDINRLFEDVFSGLGLRSWPVLSPADWRR